MPTVPSLARAGRWFLESGIQEPSGGVARYYQSEFGRNKPVSTEITGYTASALIYLFTVTGDEAYLERARKTARFLVDHAWDAPLQTFPFEHPSPSSHSHHQSYFFDCGIIIRGLLAVWRITREERLLEIALAAARGMVMDFHAGMDYHPILALPDKAPVSRTGQWSRSPGCYQLKAALSWLDLWELTSEEPLRIAWCEMLEKALASHRKFLPGVSPHQTMDRLHAYCYFLEALTPVVSRSECAGALADGIEAVSGYLQAIGPSFTRSDVVAQLLRIRIFGAAVTPVNRAPAEREAATLIEFQSAGDDPRLNGGFSFGRRDGALSPHVNPVSTAFALQALEMWSDFEAGKKPPCRHLLI